MTPSALVRSIIEPEAVSRFLVAVKMAVAGFRNSR
jgi:hypothetical protein